MPAGAGAGLPAAASVTRRGPGPDAHATPLRPADLGAADQDAADQDAADPGSADLGPADLDPAHLDVAVEVLRLLADPTRLALLRHLAAGERSVGALALALDRPVPAVSQHLARLRGGQLVRTRREASTVHYRLANEHVAALVAHVLHQAEHVRHPFDPPHHAPGR